MILNLTQHQSTPEQVEAGVVDIPNPELRDWVRDLLTFEEPPQNQDIVDRAATLARIAADLLDVLSGTQAEDDGSSRAMIGGALWLMAPLSRALRARGLDPVFAFSARETVEEAQPDGSVRKTAVFRHRGWVAAL